MRLSPSPAADGYGHSNGVPLCDATIHEGPAGSPGPRELWRLAGTVTIGGHHIGYDQRLTVGADGAFLLHARDAALRIDATAGALTVEAESESWARQLVTTYGIPLLLGEARVLILHACAAVGPDRDGAVVVCAASGTGKSTLLTGLVQQGWRAVTEDLAVLDLRGGEPVVWPGPPWVRGNTGPDGAKARFETPDKTAWDIEPWQVERAVPVRRVVFMEPPRSPTTWRDMTAGEAVAHLVRASVWLSEPQARAARMFQRCAAIASAVPSAELRLAVSDDWVDRATESLESS